MSNLPPLYPFEAENTEFGSQEISPQASVDARRALDLKNSQPLLKHWKPAGLHRRRSLRYHQFPDVHASSRQHLRLTP